MTDTILARLAPTAHGKYIGVITLNNPKALNAQDLGMVKTIRTHLDTWMNDDSVAVVVLHGTGDKGLCAGGDIKALYGGASGATAHDFFTHEYGLMHARLSSRKPFLAWGVGVGVGGGRGLFGGFRQSVVTSATLMAMPEVSIGLFPDAGASYFLNHLAGKIGLFLGLTGARFTGADAWAFGLADFAIGHDRFDELIGLICQIDFKDDRSNHHLLSACLNDSHDTSILGESELSKAFDEINHLMNVGDLMDIDKALMAYDGDNDFIKSAIDIYKNGSDTTKAITFKIYHDLKTTKKDFSLKQIFDLETVVATHCVNHGDFKEGVRALLIDKDKSPKWRHTLADMPVGYIDEFFGEFV